MRSFFFCIIFSISIASNAQVHPLNWLAGEWTYTEDGSVTTEKWQLFTNGSLKGSSQTVKDGKVTWQENLSIESEDGHWTYVAELPDKTAYFKLTDQTESSAKFTDPENDFPSSIIYDLKDDGLHIELVGTTKGEPHKISMLFQRQ